jgi:heme/copper-type cytochrome/quinol oxidase subunit 2
MPKTRISIPIAFAFLCVLPAARMALAADTGGPRIIDVTADQDNRFKVPKQKEPVITMKVNEVAVLRITARKGGEWDMKDGAIHTFTITALKDRGWDFRLKEGVQKFPVVAPSEPGEYAVECTVKCGKGHDDMKMKLVVTP